MSTIKVDRIEPSDGIQTNAMGGIVQVVSTNKFDEFSDLGVDYTSVGGIDIPGFAATIVPRTSSNKILVQVVAQIYGTDQYTAGISIWRNGTLTGSYPGKYAATSYYADQTDPPRYGMWNTLCANFIDDPGETNSLTYQVRLHNDGRGIASTINWHSGDATGQPELTGTSSNITLMEITA